MGASRFSIDRLTGFDCFCIFVSTFLVTFFGAAAVSALGQL